MYVTYFIIQIECMKRNIRIILGILSHINENGNTYKQLSETDFDNRIQQGTINRLEQEKGKLENYAKRTLTSFKEKYMTALQGMKQEKCSLQERLSLVTARAEHNQETSRREERLMLSAMYEVRMHSSYLILSCSQQNIGSSSILDIRLKYHGNK